MSVVDERRIAAADNTTVVSTDEIVPAHAIQPAGTSIQNYSLNTDQDFEQLAKLINNEFKKLTVNYQEHRERKEETGRHRGVRREAGR